MTDPSNPATGIFSSPVDDHDTTAWQLVLATICLVWYCIVLVVCSIGYFQLQRCYSSAPEEPVSSSLPEENVPHLTILRPVKGLEPHLYECLAASFQQTYPRDRLSICLCIESRADPALPILERLIEDYPHHDAKIYIEEEDPLLHSRELELGPNPKIRNLSRAYREAKGDIVWVIDCNVWVGKGVGGRMVDKLCGFSKHGRAKPYKVVHQLPMAIDVSCEAASKDDATTKLLNGSGHSHVESIQIASTSTTSHTTHDISSDSWSFYRDGGGRLEELFLASSHAKFYTAINTVSIAPCLVGKSNMFRRSHLSALTAPGSPPYPSRNQKPLTPGIDHFSWNICEDHLIGDLLWKRNTSRSPDQPSDSPYSYGNHALLFGDLAIQPLRHMSIREYLARRSRWLRVRKYTVLAATLVEPGTESFLCSSFGAFALTTLPFFRNLGVPGTWKVFLSFWILSVTIWAAVDWTVYLRLHSGQSVELDSDTPSFARPGNLTPSAQSFLGKRFWPEQGHRRPFTVWLLAWLGREMLALPIWLWAVWGGAGVKWRGRRFWVGMDMHVYGYDNGDGKGRKGTPKGEKDS